MSVIHLAMIEDAAPFAAALEKFFRVNAADIECIAIYPTAEAALRCIPENAPDVALVDVNLPKISGIECIARLKALCPTVICLILTMYEDTPVIFDALKAGACGYLLKRTPPEEIAAAVRQAHAGGAPMSPQIARQVVGFFRQCPKQNDLSDLSDLTSREREVLDLLASGSQYKEIASRLGMALDTVRTHLRSIYEKLHVHSRTEAVLKYLGDG